MRSNKSPSVYLCRKIHLSLVLRKFYHNEYRHAYKDSDKYEEITQFGGIFYITEPFYRYLVKTIDSRLAIGSMSAGHQYSGIIRGLLCIYVFGRKCLLTSRLI